MRLFQRAGSPFWQYSFTVHGRRFRGSTGTDNKTVARIKAAAALTEAQAAVPQQDKWRVRHLTGTYLTAQAQHSANVATVTYQLANLNRLLGKDRFISDLAGKDIITYRARRKAEGVANGSINRELTLLRAALGMARDHYGQAVPQILWKGLFLPEPPGRTRFLSREEYDRLIAACDDELRLIVMLAVHTGLRRANIEALAWEQIDMGARAARFVTKGGKAHVVRLSAPVLAGLGTTPPEKRRGPLFTMPNRRRRWNRAVKTAKLGDFRFHDLRHTFASWARIAGADLADISEALGHASLTMTMRYAHITPETHRTAFDAVAGLFSGGSAQPVAQCDDETPKKQGNAA